MTKTVLSVQADDTVIHAASLMVMNKVRTLPVMDDSKVVGTVNLSRQGVLWAILAFVRIHPPTLQGVPFTIAVLQLQVRR